MAGWRRPIELAVNDVEVAALKEISRSRSEPAIRVQRARILLAYRESLSFFAVGHALGVHHQTVQRCVERAAVEGPMAALDDRLPPGKAPTITTEAKAWIKDLACRKAKELGYPHELWTTRLLASHAREHGPAEGHGCLAKLAQGTLCKILNKQEIKPHKVRYYLERRDPEFERKMAEVLCVYREVKLIKETAAAAKQEPSDAVAIISYDELCRARDSSSYAARSTMPSESGIEYQQYQIWLDRLGIVCPVASLPAPPPCTQGGGPGEAQALRAGQLNPLPPQQ